MNRALLMQLWIFVIGFLELNLHKRVFDPVFRALTALPIGWALFGVGATVVYGVYFGPASQAILLIALAVTTVALLLANIKLGCLSRASILLGGAGLIVLTGACFVVEVLRVVTMSSDSSYMARFGQNIGPGNYEASRLVFSMWGPLVPCIHSLTHLLGQKLYWQYQPILSLDFVAIVLYTLYTVIRARKSPLEAWVVAAALTSVAAVSNIFLFHFFYIHVMIISALYMYLFVFALLKVQQQPGTAYELIAMLSFIGFGLARIEAPLYITVVFLITCFGPEWSYAGRLRLIIPFVAFFSVWYARVYFMLPPHPEVLTKGMAAAVVAGLVTFGLFAVGSGLKVLDPVAKRTPSLTVAGLAVLSVILTISKPDHMLTSLVSTLRNLLVHGNWGLTWYVIVFLVIELSFARRTGGQRDRLPMILAAYVLLVYDLAYFSIPYHLGDYDSANRLMLVALPLVLLYLSRGFAGIRGQVETSAVPVSDAGRGTELSTTSSGVASRTRSF
jgi:hypothetical protein